MSALDGIAERGHRALLVGGTGLYLRSLIDDLTFPGRFPDVAAALAAELDGGRAARQPRRPSRPWPGCTPDWPTSTRWRRPGSSRPTGAGSSGPWR